jgi:hypothetical protein
VCGEAQPTEHDQDQQEHYQRNHERLLSVPLLYPSGHIRHTDLRESTSSFGYDIADISVETQLSSR